MIAQTTPAHVRLSVLLSSHELGMLDLAGLLLPFVAADVRAGFGVGDCRNSGIIELREAAEAWYMRQLGDRGSEGWKERVGEMTDVPFEMVKRVIEDPAFPVVSDIER
jgi:hypothetical protein